MRIFFFNLEIQSWHFLITPCIVLIKTKNIILIKMYRPKKLKKIVWYFLITPHIFQIKIQNYPNKKGLSPEMFWNIERFSPANVRSFSSWGILFSFSFFFFFSLPKSVQFSFPFWSHLALS